MKNRNRKIYNLTLTGIFAALITIFTAYIGHIPVGANGGYVHFGDTIIYLAATILPMPYAMAAGAIGGYFLINPFFTEILRSYGIRSADLIVKPFISVMTSISVAALIFILSFIMSGKMKTLSAYKLIQE